MVMFPDSRGRTWDMIRGGFGPDVAFLDRALSSVFSTYNVDTARLAIAGFSDGASYALSLGLANADLLTHVLVYSPGYMRPPAQVGAPRILITHGQADAVLHIDHCSRRIAPQLRRSGYDVTYVEFPGPHTVPIKLSVASLDWFLKNAPMERCE